MANKNVGSIDCPICGKGAHVRETKKFKVYIVCDDCGFQGFARGHTANDILRKNMRNVTIIEADILPVITVKPAVTLEAPPVITVKPAVTLHSEGRKTEGVIQAPPGKKELTIFDSDFWKGKDNATSDA